MFKAIANLTNGLQAVSNEDEEEIYVWNPPTVSTTPPNDSIPADASELGTGKVNWLNNKYVGIVGDTVRIAADGTTNNNFTGSDDEDIDEFTWDLGSEGSLVQNEDQIVSFTPSVSNLDGSITVKVTTNLGIKSNSVTFPLKIYNLLNVNAGGPYDGIPSQDVTLQGSIINIDEYGDSPTTSYQWRVSNEAGLEFDGTSDYVNAGSGVNLANQSFTVAAWVKRGRSNAPEWVISQGQGVANMGLHFGFRSNNIFAFAFWANDLDVPVATVPESTDTQNWHHWVGTYDETAGVRKVYVDGVEKASDNPTVNYQGTGNLIIGSRFDTSGYFQGNIDDVAIFNRALDSDEVAELADTLLSGSETDLLGYWAFDEGDGTTAADDSPNNNHGTLHGDPTWPSRNIDASSDSSGSATYAWTSARDAVFGVEFEAELTTVEGLTLSDTDISTVAIQGGSPIARPGGPYQGGISGGNFANVQLQGNPPNTTETDTAGIPVEIVDWEWVLNTGVPYNQGLQFDGIDDQVNIGTTTVDLTNGLTLSAWVRTDAADGIIIRSNSWKYGIRIDGNGHPFSWVKDVSNANIVARGNTNIVNDGFWHHLVGIYDGDTVALYIDGALRANQAIDAEIPATITESIVVGYSSGAEFAGRIDDVSVWERSLSEVEREILSTGKLPNTSRLVGYWDFSEGGGTIAGNLKSGGNDATLGTAPDNPTWVPSTFETPTMWTPVQTYAKAGDYDVSLRVQADTGRWSTVKNTTVSIVEGAIGASCERQTCERL